MPDRTATDNLIVTRGEKPSAAAQAGDDWQAALLNVADMLGPVAHELHNVMNNIVLQAALVARDAPQSLRQDIAVFGKLAVRASEMLNQLDQYRYDVRYPRLAVPVADIVRGVMEGHRQRGVAIRGQIADVPPVWGNDADVKRLAELLIAAASRLGSPAEVELSAASGQVLLHVADRGNELGPDQLAQLFDPFAVTRSGEDSLLRAACRVVARRLGASLAAEQRPGGGVVVTAEFAAATAQPQAVNEASECSDERLGSSLDSDQHRSGRRV
jgi:signal transduction histidine kinase